MKEFDVFISYSSRNSEIADKICKLLEDKNIECWIAPRDIPMGRKYASIISSAIKSCKIMVLVFSEYAAASPWVESEVAKAFDNKKIIIPFKIEDIELEKYPEFDIRLSNKHWVNAFPDPSTELNQLSNVVTTILGVAQSSKTSVTLCPCGSGLSFEQCHGKRWKVGDFYSINGVEGVVFHVDALGQHGKIVSLEEEKQINWAIMQVGMQGSHLNLNNKEDGYANKSLICKVDNWKQAYPAFNWCSAISDEWYLPALNELEELLSDGTLEIVNKTLIAHGANPLIDMYSSDYFWSSTEYDGINAYVVKIDGQGYYSDKWLYYRVRAIRTF